MGQKHYYLKKFKDAVKAKHAISVNSCTAALHLALKALNLKKVQKLLCQLGHSLAL